MKYQGIRLQQALVAALVTTALHSQVFAQALPAVPVSPRPSTDYEYDANGNLTKVIQAKGQAGFGFTTKNDYDKLDRLETSFDPKAFIDTNASKPTKLGYDGRDNVTSVIDPRSLSTEYRRNGFGDIIPQVSPDTGGASYTYDEAGKVKTRTDASGAVSTLGWDALNRLVSVSHASRTKGGTAGNAYGWTYDQTGDGFSYGIGRLTTITFPKGSTTYAYSALGHLVRATTKAGPLNQVVTYERDDAGNVNSITYPSGQKVTITLDKGRPTALSLSGGANQSKNAGGTPQLLLDQITFEPFGPINGWRWQTSTGTQDHARVYDTSGRMVRYRLGPTIRDLSFDAANRITSFTHYDAKSAVAQPVLDQSFGYDQLSRLTRITTISASWVIDYDANGNRKYVTLDGASRIYTTPPTSNKLTSISSPSRNFAYTGTGNVYSDDAGYTADYMPGEHQIAVLNSPGRSARYHYNNFGQRICKEVTVNGATTTTWFVYDPKGHLLGEYDNLGRAIAEYVWLGDTPVAVLKPDAKSMDAPPTVYYVHADHLNTPRVIVDQNNNVRWRWLSEPFGTAAPETNPANLGNFVFNLRMPGQYADAESGLFYNRHRFYDPSTGRYVQSDPIGLAGGVNTYAYVDENPLSGVDPMGLCDCSGILESAEKLNGDKEYGYYGSKGPGPEKNKCNAFVADVLEGTDVAPRRWGGLGGPISAGTWADPNADIPNFPVVSIALPGDVVAIAHAYSDASGHVAIVGFDPRTTIGAGADGSHTTGWPWDETRSPQGTPVFRRCTCSE